MRKRIVLLLTALCLGGMLTACSGSGNDPAATTPAATAPEETTGSEPAVEDVRLVVGGETDYVIVRPEVDKYNDTNTAMFLRGYLKSCGSYDLIFLDPPYDSGLAEKALEAIKAFDILSKGGIIICETRADTVLPELEPPYALRRQYRYGKVKLTTYVKETDA